MKEIILEIMIGAFKRKLIASDMVEMNKIAGGINEATKAHYLPIIDKQDELLNLYSKCLSSHAVYLAVHGMGDSKEDIKLGLKLRTELAALKDKLKDK